MFPDLSTLERNTLNEGKAFSVAVGSSMGITNRQSSAKMEGGMLGHSAPRPIPGINRPNHFVVLKSGQRLPADSVVLGMGVKPEVGLAKDASLEIGKLGGIRVNEHLQTSSYRTWKTAHPPTFEKH